MVPERGDSSERAVERYSLFCRNSYFSASNQPQTAVCSSQTAVCNKLVDTENRREAARNSQGLFSLLVLLILEFRLPAVLWTKLKTASKRFLVWKGLC